MGVIRLQGTDPTYSLGSRCLIGRHPGCDLHVDNPRVSSEHATVRWSDDHWELRDLGSKNGTVADGRRLSPGERAVLRAGSTFMLGGEVEIILLDAGPPVPSARNAATGTLRIASSGLLVLPDEERPEVSVFEDASGLWVVEDGSETRPVRDREVVVAAGDGWIVDLPSSAGATVEVGALAPSVETISLHFAVSSNEEHIVVTVIHEGRETRLATRTYHYMLLTLARARIEDTAESPAERGWINRDRLCRMVGTDPSTLNVDIYRLRRQVGALGVAGAAGLIVRRPGGQIRLATDRVEITKL